MSRLGRFARLGALSGRVAGTAVRERVRRAFGAQPGEISGQLRRAEDLVATLGQLKGAAMKVGQQLAVAASSLDLPDDIRVRLDTLLDDAEPVPFDTIRRAVEDELDAPLDELFARFDTSPLGTASLGQAHAACLHDGTEVVVKVQHPGVAEGLEADLLALRGMMLSGRLFGRQASELEDIYAEVAEHLRLELDYLQEAVNLTAFVELFGDDPRFELPRPVPSHSGFHVLTMTRVSGVSMRTFVQEATPEARQRAGRSLADWFFESTFHHRLLHADPHPGNYLFQPDGTVAVLDFGCVKRFETSFLVPYARAVLGGLDGDRAALVAACEELGVLPPGPGHQDAARAVEGFCEAALSPWRCGESTIGQEADLVQRCMPASRELWKYPEIRGARDMVYLHRTLAGLYGMARDLEVRASWGDLLRGHLRRAIDTSAGRVSLA